MRRFLLIPLLAVLALAAMASPAFAAKPSQAAATSVSFAAYWDMWSTDTNGVRTTYEAFTGCGYGANAPLEIIVSGANGEWGYSGYIYADTSGCFNSNRPASTAYYLFSTTLAGSYTASVYSAQNQQHLKLLASSDFVVEAP
jgi:hypothetical protein